MKTPNAWQQIAETELKGPPPFYYQSLKTNMLLSKGSGCELEILEDGEHLALESLVMNV